MVAVTSDELRENGDLDELRENGDRDELRENGDRDELRENGGREYTWLTVPIITYNPQHCLVCKKHENRNHFT